MTTQTIINTIRDEMWLSDAGFQAALAKADAATCPKQTERNSGLKIATTWRDSRLTIDCRYTLADGSDMSQRFVLRVERVDPIDESAAH